MLFSSPVFLFVFLPLLLAAYFIAPRLLHNSVLLIASLLFYTWGEPRLVGVMLMAIAANYLLGLWVQRVRLTRAGPYVASLAVTFNLGVLGYFKYSEFFISNVIALLPTWTTGISFYIFQAMSYVIDVYRGTTAAQRNPLNLALYVVFFPQLIAGPIVRYVDVAHELDSRAVDLADFAHGMRRFVTGLGKKMLIANSCAAVADVLFAAPPQQLPANVAWLGLICYSLQIYFDFSGYSDMAIGLGRMFGFHFVENFNYPYAAQSITDFWRRWHISLSSWFRDYLYIPLGGNRCGLWRTAFNLVIVFLLCGLWHGAEWTFVVWGAVHGCLLIVERYFRHVELGTFSGHKPAQRSWIHESTSWPERRDRRRVHAYSLPQPGVSDRHGGRMLRLIADSGERCGKNTAASHISDVGKTIRDLGSFSRSRSDRLPYERTFGIGCANARLDV